MRRVSLLALLFGLPLLRVGAQPPRPEPFAVEIGVGAASGRQLGDEVVVLGVGLPPGARVREVAELRLVGAAAATLRPLARRPDGSLHVVRVAARVPPGTRRLLLTRGRMGTGRGRLRVTSEAERTVVDTGAARFFLPPGSREGLLLETAAGDRLHAGLRDGKETPLVLGHVRPRVADGLVASFIVQDRSGEVLLSLGFREGSSRVRVTALSRRFFDPESAPELLLALRRGGEAVDLVRDDALGEGWVGWRDRWRGGVFIAGGLGFSARRGGRLGLAGDLAGRRAEVTPWLLAHVDFAPPSRAAETPFLDRPRAVVLAGGDPALHQWMADDDPLARPLEERVARALEADLRRHRAVWRPLAEGSRLDPRALRPWLWMRDCPLLEVLALGDAPRPTASFADRARYLSLRLALSAPGTKEALEALATAPLETEADRVALRALLRQAPLAVAATRRLHARRGARALVAEEGGVGSWRRVPVEHPEGRPPRFRAPDGAFVYLLAPEATDALGTRDFEALDAALPPPARAGLRQEFLDEGLDLEGVTLLAYVPPGRTGDPREGSLVATTRALVEALRAKASGEARRARVHPLWLLLAASLALSIVLRANRPPRRRSVR